MRYIPDDPREPPPRWHTYTEVASAREAAVLATRLSAEHAASQVKQEPEPEPDGDEP